MHMIAWFGGINKSEESQQPIDQLNSIDYKRWYTNEEGKRTNTTHSKTAAK